LAGGRGAAAWGVNGHVRNSRTNRRAGARPDDHVAAERDGVVHQVIEAVQFEGYEGIEIIDESAARIRDFLTVFAEHHSDEELEVVTRILTTIVLIVGDELDLGDLFAS
jgi:hypothetical protein